MNTPVPVSHPQLFLLKPRVVVRRFGDDDEFKSSGAACECLLRHWSLS